MTPPRSRWSRSAAGGTPPAAATTRPPGGCVINSIAATTTRTGLTVQACLDDGFCPTGVKVTSAQMAALPVSRHPFHGDWN